MTGLFDPQDPSVSRIWRAMLKESRGEPADGLAPWNETEAAMLALYGPLLVERVVIGQLGQSLDGHIATMAGASHYVTGPESLVHLHRLRALVDAVVVGWPTAEADDPQLTVRHVEGPNPLRVVIDGTGRIRARIEDGMRMFTGTAPGAVRLTGVDTPPLDGVESIAVPLDRAGHMTPDTILRALAARGCRRVLIEGGGRLVSRFVEAGALDRLHVGVAPLITGSGRTGLGLPGVERLGDAIRPAARHYPMGRDVLFDLDLGQTVNAGGGAGAPAPAERER